MTPPTAAPTTIAKTMKIRSMLTLASRLARSAFAERGLRRGKTRDRHAKRRARHVIELGFVAERNRRRIAAMFAADADLEFGPRLASAFDADAHQLADALLVD